MQTLKAILSSPATSILAFILFWLLLNWPVLLIPMRNPGTGGIAYFFTVWAAIIAFMFAKALLEETERTPESGDR